MSSPNFRDLLSEPACQCGMNNGLYCSPGCPSAVKATDNLIGEGYLMPPPSPDLSAMSDDVEVECEGFCREEIESERIFNEGRKDTPQLIDTSISDIANGYPYTVRSQSSRLDDAFYEASESMDDCNDVEPPGDEPANLLVMLAEKNECIQLLTDKLNACDDTIESWISEANTRADKLAHAQEVTYQSLKCTDELRNVIEDREEDIKYLQQSVATGNETIESLRYQLGNLSEVYTTKLARRGSLLEAAEKAREQSIREHNEAISKKEEMMRQLAERLIEVEASNQEMVDLLQGEISQLSAECNGKKGAINGCRIVIADIREKLVACDQTIIEQRKQIDSLETENQHLARALVCEREIVDDQTQEIADYLQKTESITRDLASTRLEKERNEKDAFARIGHLQSIIHDNSVELERLRLERQKEAEEALERLEVVIASKDELLEKARLERKKEAKDALARLEVVISSRAELLQKAREERERDAKRAVEKIRISNELLNEARRVRDEEAEESQKKQNLFHKIISWKTEALSKARHDVSMTLQEKDSLVNEKEQLHQAFTAAKKAHVAQAQDWQRRFNEQAQASVNLSTAQKAKLGLCEAQLAKAESDISALKASNTTLKTTLEQRTQDYGKALETSQAEKAKLADRNNKFKASWNLLFERYARLVRLNNDLATDADGWDRVASDDTFQIESTPNDTIELKNEDEDRDDVDVESLADEAEIEHMENTGEVQGEQLPTYGQSIDQDADCSIIESESADSTDYGSMVDPDEDDLTFGEEDDDWSDMSE